MEQPRREAGGVQREPEAVARPGEMVAGGGGVKAGVDAAEENPEPRRDHILKPLAAGSFERRPVRPDG